MNSRTIEKELFDRPINFRSIERTTPLPEIRIVDKAIQNGSLPKGFNDDVLGMPDFRTRRFMRGRSRRSLRRRGNFQFTNNRNGGNTPDNKFTIVHDYYKLMINRKNIWYAENPCATCSHDLHGHYKYIKSCMSTSCGCSKWKNTSLEKYTNGMYKSKWYNFRWRFRNNNSILRL